MNKKSNISSRMVVIENGKALVKDIPLINEQDIIFVVTSASDEINSSVAEAISVTYNSWIKRSDEPSSNSETDMKIRKCGNWHNDFDILPPKLGDEHYVYGYGSATCADKNIVTSEDIFYIGRGQRNRMLNHIKEALKDQDTKEMSKKDRINKEMNQLKSTSLVHQIARFSGPNCAEQTDAVENFLITYWLGVYNLTNLTRGNTTKKGVKWIVRPKDISKDCPSWLDAVKQMSCGDFKITQSVQRELLVDEILKSSIKSNELQKNLKVKTNHRLKAMFVNGRLFFTDGVDAHAKFELLNDQQKAVFLIQFRLSNKEIGVCINIRPIKGGHQTFSSDICRYFGAFSAKNRIKNKNTGVYFKPFAILDKKKAKDIYFNFSDIDSKNLVQGVEWLGPETTIKVSLIEALNMIISKI